MNSNDMTVVDILRAPDKTAISKAIKAGEEIPGAMLGTSKSLQVK